MPLYEYICTECKRRVEFLQKFSDPEVSDCSDCGGELERVLSVPAIRFKGSGWYVTDYAGKNSNGARYGETSSNSNDSTSSGGSESESSSQAKTGSSPGVTK